MCDAEQSVCSLRLIFSFSFRRQKLTKLVDFHTAQTKICSGKRARCLQREAQGALGPNETPFGSGNALIGSLLQASFGVPQGGGSRAGLGCLDSAGRTEAGSLLLAEI